MLRKSNHTSLCNRTSQTSVINVNVVFSTSLIHAHDGVGNKRQQDRNKRQSAINRMVYSHKFQLSLFDGGLRPAIDAQFCGFAVPVNFVRRDGHWYVRERDHQTYDPDHGNR